MLPFVEESFLSFYGPNGHIFYDHDKVNVIIGLYKVLNSYL